MWIAIKSLFSIHKSEEDGESYLPYEYFLDKYESTLAR